MTEKSVIDWMYTILSHVRVLIIRTTNQKPHPPQNQHNQCHDKRRKDQNTAELLIHWFHELIFSHILQGITFNI